VPRASAYHSLGCIVREKQRQAQSKMFPRRGDRGRANQSTFISPCLLSSLENRHVVRAFEALSPLVDNLLMPQLSVRGKGREREAETVDAPANRADRCSAGGCVSGRGDLLQGRLAASTSRSTLSKSRPSMRNLFGPRISSGSYVYLQPSRTEIQSPQNHRTERGRGFVTAKTPPRLADWSVGNPKHTRMPPQMAFPLLGLQDNHLGGRQTRFTSVSQTIDAEIQIEPRKDCDYGRTVDRIENRQSSVSSWGGSNLIPDVFPTLKI
jgi:hypothetical protein